MDPVRNPFAPGAGSTPPELAGRDDVISNAKIALQRAIIGNHARSQLLLGLRGTGKTVLLTTIEQLAATQDHVTSMIEAPESGALPALLFPKLQQVLRRLSLVERSRVGAHQAFRALRSFASAWKIKIGDISIAVEPEAGVADSGDLETDLAELFVKIGQAAQSAGRGWTLLIDEVQYLAAGELAALIVAIHRVNQLRLPVLFFGAGLPQVAALSGNAKSYAERLFDYPVIGALDFDAACAAIEQPIRDQGEAITPTALRAIADATQGYPYFLQEWGYQAWQLAAASPIEVDHVKAATVQALRRLDAGFFRVRLDRLTDSEQDYVLAMASIGSGPYRSREIADKLKTTTQAVGPRRDQIIKKGMIYSIRHGQLDFTVPMFDDFLRRTYTIQRAT
ncbi:MAG: ATP-binding protein [Alphaproteobacteria bacterium]|nr:ATP-binding protein [Alphaproteobacteria bacterium]